MQTVSNQNIQLELPVMDVSVNQGWGLNYLSFYKKLGLLGHNGTDLFTYRGCPIRATHDGIVIWAGEDGGGGIGVTIANTLSGLGFKTISYHLLRVNVKKNQEVKTGDIIGFADNTGIYTTGDHLHFGLKEIFNGATLNHNNGYKGAINPEPHFKKDWEKSNAYHRYGRKKEYWPEYWFRFAPVNIKNRWAEGGRYVHKTLKRLKFASPLLTTDQANAIIYGGWGLNDVLNPSLRFNGWGYIKKVQFESGIKTFKR